MRHAASWVQKAADPRSLDGLKTGNARTPALSPTLVKMFTEAWTTGSLELEATDVRTGFTILALAKTPELRRLMMEVSREFSKIDGEVLRKSFHGIVAGSSEGPAVESAAGEEAVTDGKAAAGKAGRGKTANLNQITSY